MFVQVGARQHAPQVQARAARAADTQRCPPPQGTDRPAPLNLSLGGLAQHTADPARLCVLSAPAVHRCSGAGVDRQRCQGGRRHHARCGRVLCGHSVSVAGVRPWPSESSQPRCLPGYLPRASPGQASQAHSSRGSLRLLPCLNEYQASHRSMHAAPCPPACPGWQSLCELGCHTLRALRCLGLRGRRVARKRAAEAKHPGAAAAIAGFHRVFWVGFCWPAWSASPANMAARLMDGCSSAYWSAYL